MSTFRLQAPNGDIIHLDCETGKLYFKLNRAEAKGAFQLEPCSYGYRVRVEDVTDQVCTEETAGSVGLLDFFWASASGAENGAAVRPVMQFIIDDPRLDDPVGRVRWFKDHTEVNFERGVQPILFHENLAPAAYGYPLDAKMGEVTTLGGLPITITKGV